MLLRAFNESLQLEHLEKLAGITELRARWLAGWNTTREAIAGLEHRMEAHLDALVLGAPRTLEQAAIVARAGAPWTFYAWIALACRTGRHDMLREALLTVQRCCREEGANASALRRAVTDALVHHMPDPWADIAAGELRNASPHGTPVLARCVGVRGWVQAAGELQQAALRPSADVPTVLHALSLLPDTALDPLLDPLTCPEPSVVRAAATAALRRGAMSLLDGVWRNFCAPWVAIPLAMASGPAMGQWLTTVALENEPVQALIALGFLGDPNAVDVLLDHLHTREHAVAAAIGLFLITGARPKRSDPDDDERRAPPDLPLSDRSPSLSGSGIGTDGTEWALWMRTHRARLRPGVRYRLGQIAHPLNDLTALSSTSMPLWLRRLWADEFVIRYGIPWAYEPDRLIAPHQQMMATMDARLDELRLRFTQGAWYFQGWVVQ